MEFGGASVSGPRPYNEDAFLTIDLGPYSGSLGGLVGFLLVSDGMGGHQSGDVASRVAVESAKAYVDDLIAMAGGASLQVDAAQALREMVTEANAAVLRAGEERGATSMGATFIAALVSRDRAWIGHVGDSRAYLLGPEGGRQLTVDHSQVGRMIADGVLTEEQAQHHPSRNVIERALGFSGAEAEITEVDLGPGDALVLCSDGMSTVLTGADMRQIAASAPSAGQAADRLCAESVAAGTDDNATVVVWSENWSLFQATLPRVAKGRRAASIQRRQASRHVRATRTSFIVLGVVAVAALAVFAVAMSGPKGGGAPAPARIATSDKATRTVDATKPATPASQPAPADPKMSSGKVGKGVNLRTSESKDNSLNVFATTSAEITIIYFPAAEKGWSEVSVADLKSKKSDLQIKKPDLGWPAHIYVATDKVD